MPQSGLVHRHGSLFTAKILHKLIKQLATNLVNQVIQTIRGKVTDIQIYYFVIYSHAVILVGTLSAAAQPQAGA